MKIFALFSTIVMMILVVGCNQRPRPKILEIRDDLEIVLKLESVSSSAGMVGAKGSDQETSLWIIPKESDSDAIYEKLKDSTIALLEDKGAEVVSSGSGAGHGYKQEYLNQGGNVSSYTVVYKFDEGLGFIVIFRAQYIAEKEAGRVGFNHIFIPNP